jgi:hypothetical protein
MKAAVTGSLDGVKITAELLVVAACAFRLFAEGPSEPLRGSELVTDSELVGIRGLLGATELLESTRLFDTTELLETIILLEVNELLAAAAFAAMSSDEVVTRVVSTAAIALELLDTSETTTKLLNKVIKVLLVNGPIMVVVVGVLVEATLILADPLVKATEELPEDAASSGNTAGELLVESVLELLVDGTPKLLAGPELLEMETAKLWEEVKVLRTVLKLLTTEPEVLEDAEVATIDNDTEDELLALTAEEADELIAKAATPVQLPNAGWHPWETAQ